MLCNLIESYIIDNPLYLPFLSNKEKESPVRRPDRTDLYFMQ